MVRILMNVRFVSLVSYHHLYLNVRFQYKADILLSVGLWCLLLPISHIKHSIKYYLHIHITGKINPFIGI